LYPHSLQERHIKLLNTPRLAQYTCSALTITIGSLKNAYATIC